MSWKARPPAGKPIRFYWWPLWMFLLGLALFVFYGILTPVWIGIRLVARVSDRGRSRRAAAGEAGSID